MLRTLLTLILLAEGGTACSTPGGVSASGPDEGFWRGYQRSDLQQAEFERRLNTSSSRLTRT